jgi:hypothetical protein
MRTLLFLVVGFLICGCGRSGNPSDSGPSPAAKPDVIITFDGARHACSVALYNEAQPSSVPCGEVLDFVRDQLRVPSGSKYQTRKMPQVDPEDVAKVLASLNGAGYRLLGGSGSE